MAIRFLHTPKNKQFNFRPRYYDEQKEDLENRIESIKREMGTDELNGSDKPYVPNIKGQMRGYFRKSGVKQKRQSTVRLFVIIAILLTAAYFILYF